MVFPLYTDSRLRVNKLTVRKENSNINIKLSVSSQLSRSVSWLKMRKIFLYFSIFFNLAGREVEGKIVRGRRPNLCDVHVIRTVILWENYRPAALVDVI